MIKQHTNYISLKVYIIPNSSLTEIKGIYNDAIKIKSPPIENAANEELISFDYPRT